MMTKSLGGYTVLVHDEKLIGREIWPDDEFASEDKSMNEIIINAANYASAPNGLNPGGAHYSCFDRPDWCEPRRPESK